ncbi:MAG: hypothetical protein O9301_03695 [Leptospira sp.]|nr:hypothetical protein [Leptospira sp.]
MNLFRMIVNLPHILLGFLIVFLGSGIQAKTHLLRIQDELLLSSKQIQSKEIRNWIQKKKVLTMVEENCKIQQTSSYEKVTYFGLYCDERKFVELISFESSRKKDIPKDSFRLKKLQQIGKKKYFEIEISEVFGDKPRLEAWNDTDFQFGNELTVSSNQTNKHQAPKHRKEQFKTTQSPLNSNLHYFKEIAKEPKRRKESDSSVEVFFDTSCPLEFLEKDESFYWDRTVTYVFRISCVKDTPYSILRVPSNDSGEVVVSNVRYGSIQKGERFLGKATLRKMTEKQMFWENYVLYYE